MAHLTPPPPNINLQETKRPRMVAVFAGTWALGVLATLLRLYCRRLTKSRLWLDDWLIIISLFFSAAFMFDVTVWMASHGFGRHVWVGPPDALEVWAKGLFMAVFTYTLSLVFIKWSILAWYWRLFHIQSYMKPLIWMLFAVVCIWGVAKIIVVSLECFPIEAIWEVFDPDNPLDPSEYHCGVDIHKFFLGNAIPNIITDIFIMVLPLPYILKLHLRVSQKVALFGIFVVGTFVTIVSAIRLVFVVGLDLHSPDKTWNQAEEMMWTGVEVNIATVCANLLTLRPILNLILHGTVYVESQQHSEALNVHIGGPDSTSKGHFHLILPKRALTREGRAERPVVSKKGSTSSTQPFVQHNEFGYSHSDSQQDMEATSMGSPGVGLSESGEGRGRSSLGPDLEAPPVGVEVVDTSEEGRWF